jgi:hypothetical protein
MLHGSYLARFLQIIRINYIGQLHIFRRNWLKVKDNVTQIGMKYFRLVHNVHGNLVTARLVIFWPFFNDPSKKWISFWTTFVHMCSAKLGQPVVGTWAMLDDRRHRHRPGFEPTTQWSEVGFLNSRPRPFQTMEAESLESLWFWWSLRFWANTNHPKRLPLIRQYWS